MNEVIKSTVELSKDEIEFVKLAQEKIGTDYPINMLIKLVCERITVHPSQQLKPFDVMSVIKAAKKMGLDPTTGDIFAFKGKATEKNPDPKVVLGVAYNGWCTILSSHKDWSLHFEAAPKDMWWRKGEIIICPYIKCVLVNEVTKQKVEGTAYFDEENTDAGQWVDRPKRMLENRAMVIACKRAFGLGVYEPEEAKAAAGFVDAEEVRVIQPSRYEIALQKTKQINKEAPALEYKTADQLMEDMRKATSMTEVRALFAQASEEVRNNKEVIALGKELAQNFEQPKEEKTDLPEEI